jgi:hypothetical protein
LLSVLHISIEDAQRNIELASLRVDSAIEGEFLSHPRRIVMEALRDAALLNQRAARPTERRLSETISWYGWCWLVAGVWWPHQLIV